MQSACVQNKENNDWKFTVRLYGFEFLRRISLGALATVCAFPTSKHAYVDGINRKVVRALTSLGAQSYGQDGREFVLQNV